MEHALEGDFRTLFTSLHSAATWLVLDVALSHHMPLTFVIEHPHQRLAAVTALNHGLELPKQKLNPTSLIISNIMIQCGKPPHTVE